MFIKNVTNFLLDVKGMHTFLTLSSLQHNLLLSWVYWNNWQYSKTTDKKNTTPFSIVSIHLKIAYQHSRPMLSEKSAILLNQNQVNHTNYSNVCHPICQVFRTTPSEGIPNNAVSILCNQIARGTLKRSICALETHVVRKIRNDTSYSCKIGDKLMKMVLPNFSTVACKFKRPSKKIARKIKNRWMRKS